MRLRENTPRSLSLGGYFAPQFSAFVAILGRPFRAGEAKRMEDDAQRMNSLRKRLLAEMPEICARLWLVLFLFAEWTCEAILCLIFSSNRSSLSSLAEYLF
jgi:hypothetical protein